MELQHLKKNAFMMCWMQNIQQFKSGLQSEALVDPKYVLGSTAVSKL